MDSLQDRAFDKLRFSSSFPAGGVIKFEPYLQAIEELDIDGTVSIELEYSPDPSHIVEWVEEAYQETAPPDATVGPPRLTGDKTRAGEGAERFQS